MSIFSKDNAGNVRVTGKFVDTYSITINIAGTYSLTDKIAGTHY